jgi:hypothetical protein
MFKTTFHLTCFDLHKRLNPLLDKSKDSLSHDKKFQLEDVMQTN